MAPRSKYHVGTIVSIGYEGRTLEEFIKELQQAKVEVLVDVRLTPLSRKSGFSKTALSQALTENGIEYWHAKELGNPKENRAHFYEGRLDVGRERYLAHLNNGSRSTYEAVIERSKECRIALLCVEKDDRSCHRGCITDQAQREHPALSVNRL